MDDVAQDAFVEALRALPNLANPQAFASWIAAPDRRLNQGDFFRGIEWGRALFNAAMRLGGTRTPVRRNCGYRGGGTSRDARENMHRRQHQVRRAVASRANTSADDDHDARRGTDERTGVSGARVFIAPCERVARASRLRRFGRSHGHHGEALESNPRRRAFRDVVARRWERPARAHLRFDALRCPQCDAKLRVLATLHEPTTVKKILLSLGLRTEPLPRSRVRDPTGQDAFDFSAA